MAVGSSKGGSDDLAALLRARRHAVGMSRRDLAESTGLSYPYISQLETAYRLPSPKAMHALARALMIPAGDLFAALPQGPSSSPPAAAPQAASRWLANPAHAARASDEPGPSLPRAVRSAVDSLGALPPAERLRALNEVQAAVVAGLVEEQEARE